MIGSAEFHPNTRDQCYNKAMIQLEERYLDDTRRIVNKHVDVSLWQPVLFGSRAAGKARRFSDIDLGFRGPGPLPDGVRGRLWEAFDDSNIPYVVDIVDFAYTTPEFRAVAETHMEKLL
jgi:hypothetical protein